MLEIKPSWPTEIDPPPVGGSGVGDGLGFGEGEGLGEGLGFGEGEGLGDGFGLGEGEGLGDGFGLGEGEGLGDGLGEGEGLGDGLGEGEGEGLGDGLGEGLGDGFGFGVSSVGETGFVEGGCGLGCWFEEELAIGDFVSFTEGDTLTAGFCIGFAAGLFWEEIGDRFVGCWFARVADGFWLGFTLLLIGGLTAVGFLVVAARGF